MTEPPADPITPELVEAFDNAVAAFNNWSPYLPESEVSLNRRPYSMSTICIFVGKFADQMSDNIVGALLSYMHFQHRELKEMLGKDQSYATGARCLSSLIAGKRTPLNPSSQLSQKRPPSA